MRCFSKRTKEVLRQSEHEVHAGELFNSPITRKAWPIETSIRRVSNHVSIFSCTPLFLTYLSGERREEGFHECVGFLGSFFVPISFVYELNSV